STATGNQTAPRLAYNGTTFLVVWADHRGSSSDVYGSRVHASGAPLAPAGTAIASQAGVSETAPAVSAIGAYFVVGGQQGPTGLIDIWARRVDSSGTPLFAGGHVVENARKDQTAPAVGVVAGGQSYVVAFADTRYEDSSEIFSRQLAPDGTASRYSQK